ncbi:MAG: hypothetical protein HQK98_06420 [Nitrospirae bacterium]|nr:hypothetical protein [Nitrospirota bacterium]
MFTKREAKWYVITINGIRGVWAKRINKSVPITFINMLPYYFFCYYKRGYYMLQGNKAIRTLIIKGFAIEGSRIDSVVTVPDQLEISTDTVKNSVYANATPMSPQLKKNNWTHIWAVYQEMKVQNPCLLESEFAEMKGFDKALLIKGFKQFKPPIKSKPTTKRALPQKHDCPALLVEYREMKAQNPNLTNVEFSRRRGIDSTALSRGFKRFKSLNEADNPSLKQM